MYVIDANVLIDYRDSDLGILSLFSQKIGPILVPTLIVEEVKGIQYKQYQALGIEIYQPDTSELLLAYSQSGGLSRQDYLCMLLAQKHKGYCVTNEKLLRNECERQSIKTMRGLRMLIELCQGQHLIPQQALEIVTLIQKANPYHISDTIVQAFKLEIAYDEGILKP